MDEWQGEENDRHELELAQYNNADRIGKQVYCHNTWWLYQKIIAIKGIPCAQLIDEQRNPIYINYITRLFYNRY